MTTPIDKSPFCQQVQDCSSIDELLRLPFRLSEFSLHISTDQWCGITVIAFRSERELDNKWYTPWPHPHDAMVISYHYDWGLFEYATMALMHHLLTGTEAERPKEPIPNRYVWCETYQEYNSLGGQQ